nr:Protein of unknown function domain containing protein [Haemonchus contortus]
MAVPNGSTPFLSTRKAESLSSLPLQVAVHLNICLAPFLFIAEICCLAVKVQPFFSRIRELANEKLSLQYTYLSVTYKVILVAVLLVYVLVEVIRLFLGIVGNLGEKIPALSGFWTLSMVLQLPIVLFLLLNPAAIPVPFEIIMLSIHFLFLIVEIVTSFLTMKVMSAQQIKLFKSIIEESEK